LEGPAASALDESAGVLVPAIIVIALRLVVPLSIFRWPLAFVVVLLLFSLIYYLAPNAEQRSWRWITPGSVVGSVLWLALSGLFAVYTAFSSSYSKTYGSLAGGIVLLLWLNYSAWAVLFGAELNAEVEPLRVQG
jgi:membrane protein